MNRNPVEIIDQMLALIPPLETDIREALGSIKSKAYYTAPEQQGQLWKDVANTLQYFLPRRPAEGWQLAVAKVLTES